MHRFQLSLFYGLQVFIRASGFPRKYHTLFRALDPLSLPDINEGIGRDGSPDKSTESP